MHKDITAEEYQQIRLNRIESKYYECIKTFAKLLLNDKITIDEIPFIIRVGADGKSLYLIALHVAREKDCNSLVSALKVYQDDLLRIKKEKSLDERRYELLRNEFIDNLEFYDNSKYGTYIEYKEFRRNIPKELSG